MLRRKPPALLAFLLALSLLIPFRIVLYAAVAHVGTVSVREAGSASPTDTPAVVSSSGDFGIAGIVYYDTTTISGVTLDAAGSAFTPCRNDSVFAGTGRSAVYVLGNLPSGSHFVRVTFSGATTFKTLFYTVISGATTTSACNGAGALAEGSDTTPASGSYMGAATDFFYGLLNCPSCAASGYTVGSGWAFPTDGDTRNGGAIEYKANPGSASQNPDMTITSNSWAMSGVSIAVATAAAGGCRAALNLLGVGGC